VTLVTLNCVTVTFSLTYSLEN